MRFKVFVSICLVLIILLLSLLIGILIYTDLHVSKASKEASDKVTTFTHDVNNVNGNLQTLNSQLQLDSQVVGGSR